MMMMMDDDDDGDDDDDYVSQYLALLRPAKPHLNSSFYLITAPSLNFSNQSTLYSLHLTSAILFHLSTGIMQNCLIIHCLCTNSSQSSLYSPLRLSNHSEKL